VGRTALSAIRSTGGWFDVSYDLTACLHGRVDFGIDDPADDDRLSARTYNHYFYANSTYDSTKQLNVGIEVSS
jgi:hypothetical protein